jgi:hypothetical protein
MNRHFARALGSLRNRNRTLLVPPLKRIADAGIVAIDGCFLLREFATNVIRDRKVFSDDIEYECFVNHVHLDNYVSDHVVDQSLGYASTVLSHWNECKFDGELIAIIALTDSKMEIDDCTEMDNFAVTEIDESAVRFHLRRGTESWLSADLDGYKYEGVLELSSADLEFFKLF